MSTTPKGVRKTVLIRAQGNCERCGRNLANEKTTTHAFTVAGLFSFGMALEPRTYGATVGVKF